MNLKEPHVQIEVSKVTYSQQTSASRCQRVAVTAHLSDDLNSGSAPTSQGVSTFTADHLTPPPPPHPPPSSVPLWTCSAGAPLFYSHPSEITVVMLNNNETPDALLKPDETGFVVSGWRTAAGR